MDEAEQARSTRPGWKNTGNFIGPKLGTVAGSTLQRTDATHDLSSEPRSGSPICSRKYLSLAPSTLHGRRLAAPSVTHFSCHLSALRLTLSTIADCSSLFFLFISPIHPHLIYSHLITRISPHATHFHSSRQSSAYLSVVPLPAPTSCSAITHSPCSSWHASHPYPFVLISVNSLFIGKFLLPSILFPSICNSLRLCNAFIVLNVFLR